MDLKLVNKVAIVTGGARGIGEAAVKCFAQEGAIPVIVDRNEDKGIQVADLVKAQGKQALFVKSELINENDCRRAVEAALDTFGHIDVVVNNAGTNDGAALEAGTNEFMKSIQLNLFHYFTVVYYALDELKQNQGAIVNVGSHVADTGQGSTSGYAAAKGAIKALTREWAVSFSPYNVRVNCVIPGSVWTPLYDQWVQTFDDPEAQKRKVAQMIPLGRRFTQPEEIADTIVFLASARSSHTTGQMVFPDGGYVHLDRAYTVNN
ncbi:MAG: L-fucose dehydrogenase [Planctomycetota bacterium]|jgi:NAD(P)-dependent dehydrogenase (short-subunit alcohol dehydrogenase family)